MRTPVCTHVKAHAHACEHMPSRARKHSGQSSTHMVVHTHTGTHVHAGAAGGGPSSSPTGHQAAGEPEEPVGCRLPCQARAAQRPAPQLWCKPLPSALGCRVCPMCWELGIEKLLFCLCGNLQPISTPGRTQKQNELCT